MTTARETAGAPGFDSPEGVVRRFLWHAGTGCKFASAFAGPIDGPIFWVEQGIPRSGDDHLSTSIDFSFASAAARGHAVGLIFPLARDESDLVELVLILAKTPRWRVSELEGVSRPPGADPQAGVFSLLWKTEAGPYASVMVLGPLGWLPVHRRAPYLTVMTWTGGRDNTLLLARLAEDTKRPTGFVDMRIPSQHQAAYQSMWDQSREAAKQMRKHEGILVNAAAKPDVGFCLSPAATAIVRAALSDAEASALDAPADTHAR